MDENKDDKKGLSFQSIIPYLGSFIIFLGVVRLMFFYWQFNVSIINYLEFSEIITSFFDILIVSIIVGVIGSIVWFTYRTRKGDERRIALSAQIRKTVSFGKRMKLYLSFFLNYFLFIWMVIVLIGIIEIFNVSFSWLLFSGLMIVAGVLSSLVAFIFVVVIMEINVKLHRLSSSFKVWLISFSFIYCIVICLFTIIIAVVQATDIKNKKASYGTTIYLDDSTKLVSDRTNYYIGKTQNFIFFYHEKAKTTDVYPMDRVKQLTFKDNRK